MSDAQRRYLEARCATLRTLQVAARDEMVTMGKQAADLIWLGAREAERYHQAAQEAQERYAQLTRALRAIAGELGRGK